MPLYRACISCISQVLKTCVDLGPRYTYSIHDSNRLYRYITIHANTCTPIWTRSRHARYMTIPGRYLVFFVVGIGRFLRVFGRPLRYAPIPDSARIHQNTAKYYKIHLGEHPVRSIVQKTTPTGMRRAFWDGLAPVPAPFTLNGTHQDYTDCSTHRHD